MAFLYNDFVKRKILFIAVLSFLFCLPFFRDTIYRGHDILFHAGRIVGLVDSFQDGQIIPRVYPSFNNGYGYGTPLFYGDIFLYPFAFLYHAGLPLLVVLKIVIVLASLAATGMVFWVSERVFSNKPLAPYIAGCLYTFSHYHFLTVQVRFALGETLALVFIPLVLYSIYRVFYRKEDAWILLGTSYTLLLLAHNLSFLLYCGLFVLLMGYSLLKERSLYFGKTCMKGALLALGLSAFFLWPMLEQLQLGNFYVQNFHKYADLGKYVQSVSSIFTPFVYVDNWQGDTFFRIMSMGIPLVLLPYVLLGQKEKPGHMKYILGMNTFLFLLMIGVLPYENRLTYALQFLFRFYLILYPLAVYLGTYVVLQSGKRIQKILLCMLIFFSLVNVFSMTYSSYKASYFLRDTSSREELYDVTDSNSFYHQKELSGAEYLPMVSGVNYLRDAKDILLQERSGKQSVAVKEENVLRQGSELGFCYTGRKEESYILLPLTFYYGYQVTAQDQNGEIKTLIPFPDRASGKVAVEALPGEYRYILRYRGTSLQSLSLGISVFSVLGVWWYVLRKRKINTCRVGIPRFPQRDRDTY